MASAWGLSASNRTAVSRMAAHEVGALVLGSQEGRRVGASLMEVWSMDMSRSKHATAIVDCRRVQGVGDFKQVVAYEADQQWDEYIREEPVMDDASPDLF
jgi:hypothetical protein